MTKLRLFLVFLLLIPCVGITLRYHVDFVNMYQTAKWTHEDLSRIYADNEASGLGRFFYGPVMLVLIKPLGKLSFAAAKSVWVGLQLLSYCLFWILIHRLFPPLNKTMLGWLLVWVVSINPIHNNFQSNNIQLMLAVMLLLSEVWASGGNKTRQFLAGFLVALAGTIKIFPLFIVVFYFLTKARSVRSGIVLGLSFALVAPVLVFGYSDTLNLFQGFYQNLASYHRENDLIKIVDILCLPSLFARILMPFVDPTTVSWITKGFIVGISLLFYSYAWRQRANRAHRFQLHLWSLGLALMTLLNPSTRPHYFIFYIPAFCCLVEWWNENRLSRWAWAGTWVSFALISFTVEWIVGGKTLNNFLEGLSLPTLGMVLLCVLLVVGLRGFTETVRTSSRA